MVLSPVLGVVLFYCACSGGMLVINKLAVHHVGAPAFVTLVQFVTTAAGEQEHLSLPTADAQKQWERALRSGTEHGGRRTARRVVDVAFPATWTGADMERPKLVPLDRGSEEYKDELEKQGRQRDIERGFGK